MNILFQPVVPTWILNLFGLVVMLKLLCIILPIMSQNQVFLFTTPLLLFKKSITSFENIPGPKDTQDAIERSRKLVLRCYNALASQQELSGVQVASYLMNWDDHYTTHKFQGLFLIQTEHFYK